MKIGLLIAIERELLSFINYGDEKENIIVNNRKIYKTKINNHEIFAIKSGCGEIDAASATQLLITKFDCELIINFGVTGALEKNLRVEDLFVVKKTCNYDFDISPVDNVKKCQYEEFNDIYISLDNELVEFVKKAYPTILEATVASGNTFVEKIEDKKYLNSLGCNICDMEIAGIARTCYLCNVKCLSIKCISDTLDGNGGDFNKNVINSANKAFKVILELINLL